MSHPAEDSGNKSQKILEKLDRLKTADAPTHGGRVFSYVYDPGLSELDYLATEASRRVQWVNALDPTTFPSAALLEKDLINFARKTFHADGEHHDEAVFGTVTSGGTASCLLAVKTARDLWRQNGGVGKATIVAPTTVHAAFHKAAEYFDLELKLVPIEPVTKAVDPAAFIAQFSDQTAIAVLSAPNYPYGQIEPISVVAPIAAKQGISFHVDACFGGFVLPWWQNEGIVWDFAVSGVTSISADLHKYGYAPKGVSVLLQRGRKRHRRQFFATKNWPGYPVVNATLVGSKPAGPMAAAWAIIEYLGDEGFAELVGKTLQATQRLQQIFEDKVPGLRLASASNSPIVTVERDSSLPEEQRVDPHLFSDELRESFGWFSQGQPGYEQADGSYLSPTTHFTITPVSLPAMDDLEHDIILAANSVRGRKRPETEELGKKIPTELLSSLTSEAELSSAEIDSVFELFGVSADSSLPPQAVIMSLVELLPDEKVKQLLIEVLARQIER